MMLPAQPGGQLQCLGPSVAKEGNRIERTDTRAEVDLVGRASSSTARWARRRTELVISPASPRTAGRRGRRPGPRYTRPRAAQAGSITIPICFRPRSAASMSRPRDVHHRRDSGPSWPPRAAAGIAVAFDSARDLQFLLRMRRPAPESPIPPLTRAGRRHGRGPRRDRPANADRGQAELARVPRAATVSPPSRDPRNRHRAGSTAAKARSHSSSPNCRRQCADRTRAWRRIRTGHREQLQADSPAVRRPEWTPPSTYVWGEPGYTAVSSTPSRLSYPRAGGIAPARAAGKDSGSVTFPIPLMGCED